ncbi:MAG: transporter substrate-binding domain-containing protein [Gammaproteobacteria bacterium]|nr:transporter substrate-binding domain-containing protein [Gammaproteobacteria bacterium]MBU2156093.1 transporter substrate-binding domain-containing protein [Gammaproteobacteria bacterium]MBU2255339.1 transporter substrate-binding domain-containing protein [Gammaproteobacteria bacterium]MBU2293602.1 transporter substrate-binding domain-containing protein [Gammaproteobacteria bacterium]
MRTTRRVLAASPVFIFFALILLAPLVSADSLRVGYFDLPPHTPLPGQVDTEGTAIAYFEIIAERMQLNEVSYQRYPLSRLLQMLQRDQLDMALILAKTPGREAVLVYPTQPFVEVQPLLLVARKHPLQRVDSVEQLLPLRLGAWQDGYRSPMLRDPRLQLQTLSSSNVLNQSLEMLQAGRLEAFYYPDDLAVRYQVQHLGMQDRIRLLPLPKEHMQLYSVFSRAAAERYLKPYERAQAEVATQQGYAEFFTEHLLPAAAP